MAGAAQISPSFPPDGARLRPVGATLVRFGPYAVNLASGDLSKYGYRIKLQPKSFLVLRALLESPGEMVTREQLKARLWAENTFVEFESSLNVAVRRLREALNDEAQNPFYIETLPRQGYRFIGTPEYAALPATSKVYTLPACQGDSEAPEHVPTLAPPASTRIWKWVAVVACLIAILMAGVFSWRSRWSAHSTPLPSSVAVLPFADMSSEKDQNYFSDGLAEELLNDLAKTSGLRVAARTSSFQFRDKVADPAAIGKKLGVATILEGSVRKEGNRVRISAELVKAADGFQLWSGTYDRNLNDVFAVQDEIARAIAGELKVRLLHSPTETAPQHGTSAEAYNAYLQGRYFYERRTLDDLDKAYERFQRTVKLDPNFAPGWSALAWTSIARTEGPEGHSFEQGYREAIDAAQRALRLDPNLAEAHAALGRIKRSYDWDWAGAEAEFRKALALEPQNSLVLLGASSLQASLGNFEEAIALNRRAVEIDPLSVVAHVSMGMHAYYAGQLELATDALQKALAISPSAPDAHYFLGAVYLARPQPQQALAEFDKNRGRCEGSVGDALAYAALGQRGLADAALRQLIAHYKNEAAYQIAEVYAFRGELDDAMKWLEVARAHRDAGLPGIEGDPLMQNLTHDPRFAAFMRNMGLHP